MLAMIELQSFDIWPTENDILDGFVIVVNDDGKLKKVLYTKEYGWNTFKYEGPKHSRYYDDTHFNRDGALSPERMKDLHAGWISFNSLCELEKKEKASDPADWKQILDELISMVEAEFERDLSRYNRMDLFTASNASGDELATNLTDQKEVIDKLREASRLARRNEE